MEIKHPINKLGKYKISFLMPQQSSTFYKSVIKKWRTRDDNIPNLHLDLASHLLSLVYYFSTNFQMRLTVFSIQIIILIMYLLG